VAPWLAFSRVPRISGIVVRTGLHVVWLDHETSAVMCAKRATSSPAFLTPQEDRREPQAPFQRTNSLPIAGRPPTRAPRTTRHVQRELQARFPLTTAPSPRTTTRSVIVRPLLPPAPG
jgi:hypothetical protein